MHGPARVDSRESDGTKRVQLAREPCGDKMCFSAPTGGISFHWRVVHCAYEAYHVPRGRILHMHDGTVALEVFDRY